MRSQIGLTFSYKRPLKSPQRHFKKITHISADLIFVERKAPDPVPSQVIRQEHGADIEITFKPVKGPGADIKITFPPHPPPKTFKTRNGI